jgi:hypothetical protein
MLKMANDNLSFNENVAVNQCMKSKWRINVLFSNVKYVIWLAYADW